MHTFQTIKKLNQAVQVSLLGEASAYNFSVLKRPKYGPSAMPKGHSLIKYKNQYFLFTSEPPSEGQGATNPNWTKAAIWQCDRNGKRTAPLEDPLWDSKKDGWSAEDAFDSFLDYTDGDLSEAAKKDITEGTNISKEEIGSNIDECKKMIATLKRLIKTTKSTTFKEGFADQIEFWQKKIYYAKQELEAAKTQVVESAGRKPALTSNKETHK